MFKIEKFQKIIFVFIFISALKQNLYSNWFKVNEIRNSNCILTFENVILVGTDNGIYRSTDNGLIWSHFTVDTSYPIITDLSKTDQYIFAGTFNGVYSSMDTGKTWQQLGPFYSILSVFAKDSMVLACIHGGGLFRSENNGKDWKPINGDHFYSYITHENKIFAGTFSGIYVSIDKGLNWILSGLPNRIVNSISKNGRYFFASNYDGIFRSNDYGMTWEEFDQGLPLDELHVSSVFATDSLVFVGLTSNKIYLSKDNGTNWQDFSAGLDINQETYYTRFAMGGDKVFASFLHNSLWYCDLSEITDVKKSNGRLPQRYHLNQNFPNPFNSTTTISYTLPESDFVILKVYDMIGRELQTLVNAFQQADFYNVYFNADEIPNGIYLYQLRAGNEFLETKKMMLIR